MTTIKSNSNDAGPVVCVGKTRVRRAAVVESGIELLHPSLALTEQEACIVEQARAIWLRCAARGSVALESPRAVRDYLISLLAFQEREVFVMVSLDNRHRLIASDVLFAGTIDGSSVHPREVVKCALRHNASAVVFSHNHPSGVAEPSQADELITLRLKDALGLVDIRVLDHLIVGAGHAVSFAERGLL
jgi:DNA repair protein RadC